MSGWTKDQWIILVQRIQAGDTASEDELVRIFYPHIMALAAGRLQDRETAYEVTQETLLCVLKALREGRLREPEKLSAFVISTARNLINQSVEKRVQQRSSFSLSLNHKAFIHGQLMTNRESAVEDEERISMVHAALGRLNPIDRNILFLTLAKGLNPRDIALEMGMKPEIIRNRKSRALKIVRRTVKKMIRKGRHGHIKME